MAAYERNTRKFSFLLLCDFDLVLGMWETVNTISYDQKWEHTWEGESLLIVKPT